MIERVYHPFWTWEDIGMWRRVYGAERQSIAAGGDIIKRSKK